MLTMAQLFSQARKKGLWLWSPYQDLWFSPRSLASHQKNGRFCWGPSNWKLRDPQERLQELKAQAAYEDFKKMLEKETES